MTNAPASSTQPSQPAAVPPSNAQNKARPGDARSADTAKAASSSRQKPAESSRDRRGANASSSNKAGSSSRANQTSPSARPNASAPPSGDPQAGQELAASRAGQGGGSSLSAGDLEAKADIQQLLKEVSGELKTLQAQLDAANQQQASRPGTSTDPNLYGAPEPVDRNPSGTPLPMSLGADTAPSKTPRPGTGVGSAAEHPDHEQPQAKPEAASLSDRPLDEAAGTRQPIPPIYQEIFDRLNRTPQPTTNEKTP